MPVTTETATHVYLKQENPKGLLQSYTGPHKIVARPSHSTIQVKIGTFKSGADNIQLHHWSNAKPATVREETPEAEMPVRGRPKKVPEVTAPAPTTDTTDKSTSMLPVPQSADVTSSSGNDKNKTDAERQTNQDGGKVNNSNDGGKISKRPARSTRNANPVYVDAVGFITGPPPTPAFRKQNHMWSATSADLYIINKSIGG